MAAVLLAAPRRLNAQVVPTYTGTDQDTDGIDDGLELYLATRFFPKIHYSIGSGPACLGPLPTPPSGRIGDNWPPVQKPVVFRAFHPLTTAGFAVPDYIYLAYVLLYDQDCGQPNPLGFPGHPGDNEAFVIVVRFDGTDWQFVQSTTNPHRGAGACEKSLKGQDHTGDQTDIWPGHSKHGNYPYANPFPCSGEDTSDAPFQETTLLQHTLTNLGEAVAPFVHDLGPLSSFAGLQAWAGIDPWHDQFLKAGYIYDDVLVHGYDFGYTPPPVGDTWHSTGSETYCGFTNLGPLQLASQSGTGELSFVVTKSCAWTVRSDASWLTITSVATPQYPYPRSALAGAGPGTVTFSVGANTSAYGRSAHLFIGGLPVDVQQQGVGCNFVLSPPDQNFPISGGSGSLALTASAANCSWTATTTASWFTISPQSGVGGATLTLTVSSTNSSAARTGWIQLNGFNLLQVTQVGKPCNFVISETSVTLPHTGGTRTLYVSTTPGDCQWAATSSAGWLTVAGTTHTGSSSLSYQVASNTGPPRAGALGIQAVAPSTGAAVYAVIRESGAVDWLSPVLSLLFGKGGSQ